MAPPMAGEGPIAAAIPRSPPPSAAGGSGGGSAAEAPVLIFVHFHKAIRAELERMHAAAVRLVTTGPAGGGGGVAALEARCRFLFAVYRHHCHAEDAVRAVRAQRGRRFCCLSLHFCFAGLVLRSWRLRVTSLRSRAGWEEGGDDFVVAQLALGWQDLVRFRLNRGFTDMI